MASPLYLGIDIGTQSSKALVVDERFEVVARAQEAYGLIEGLPPQAAEQDPRTWTLALQTLLARLAASVDLQRVVALAVSGQQHGFVPLAADGSVLRPAKLWCDTATIEEARTLEARLGRPMPVGYTASKILWLREHEPQHWARLAKIALPHDYINFVLTGRFASECGDASGTGLFSTQERAWDLEAARAIDEAVPDMLPPLVEAGEVFAVVSKQAAATYGLREGTLVGVGGGDNMMAAIGAGAVSEGLTVASLGTSGTLFARSERSVVDQAGIVAPFCDAAGAWLPLLCVMNLTLVTEEVRTAFSMSHDEITARAAALPIGGGGLRMLPFFQGERVPALPHATASLDGLRHGWLDPGSLYRAGLEACLCNLVLAGERFDAFGLSRTRLRVVGGAARNALWQSSIAAAFACPIDVVLEVEAAAFGAAIQAAWTHALQHGSRASAIDTLRDLCERAVRLEVSVEPVAAEVASFRALHAAWRDLLTQRHPDAVTTVTALTTVNG